MTPAAIEADLLPCAHCGSSDVELWETLTDALVCCNNCGCRTGLVFLGADEAANAARKREAITAWNTRQPTTPTTGEDDVDRIFRAVHTKVLNLEPAADHMRRNRKIDRKDALSAIEMFRRDVITSLAAISPTTEDAPIATRKETLHVAELVELLKMARGYVATVVEAEGHTAVASDLERIDKALASIGERS